MSESSSSELWIRFEPSAEQVVERSFSQPFTLGRAAHCDVQFATRIVSSVHARIAFARDTWSVQDLNSRNGTFLNGESVRQAAIQGRGTLQLGEGGPVLEFSVGEPLTGAAPAPAASRTAPAPAMPVPEVPRAAAPDATKERPQHYRADTFTLPLPEDWQDCTVYTLLGPLNDNLQHNITVNVEPKAPFDTVDDYAAEQVAVIEGELHGCRVLKKEPVTLDSGLPAYRALFVWYPAEDLKVYQEQLYVLHDGIGYRLTATFTRKTRKLLGPQIERIMLGFTPA